MLIIDLNRRVEFLAMEIIR